jgi:DinB superfamily
VTYLAVERSHPENKSQEMSVSKAGCPGLPAHLAGLTRGLPLARLLAPPAPGEWSARDVLAHLRACSDMWGKYILLILSQDRPTFKAVNPTTWIKQTGYLEQEFRPSLQAFTAQRAGLLAVLEPLAPAAWSRSATVTGAGKPRQRTMYTYAQVKHFSAARRVRLQNAPS